MPGGQAEYLRVRLADANALVVGRDLPDERYLFLSDVLPTAWQAVRYANVNPGGTLAVLGPRAGRPDGHPRSPGTRT